MYARNKNQLFGRCRCCLDFGYHAEIHRETFLETFNLFLSTNPSLTTMICKLCIDRLNDATEFKAMVVKSEQQLLSKAEGTTSFEFRNDLLKKEHDDEWNNSGDEMETPNAADDDDMATVRSGGIVTIELGDTVKEENIKQEVTHEDELNQSHDGEDGEEKKYDQNVLSTACSEPKIARTEGSHETEQIAATCEGADDHNSRKTEKVAKSTRVRKQTGKDSLVCKVCDKIMANHQNLKAHIRTHAGDKPYACKLCDKQFSRKSHLKTHARTHTGEKPYACDMCAKVFIDNSRLIIHKRIHTGEKPYACKICDKKFTQSSNLTIHVRTHTGEKPYTCDMCGKRFGKSCHFRRHTRTHTGEKPHACTMCDKKFSVRESLAQHVKTHTGEKTFACEICDKKYAQKTNLRYHLRTHTGVKPHACSICNKKFANKAHLINHVRIHTDEKPYACQICERKFAQSCNLKKHLRTHTIKNPKSEVVI